MCVCTRASVPLLRTELPEGKAFSVLFSVVSPEPRAVLGTE